MCACLHVFLLSFILLTCGDNKELPVYPLECTRSSERMSLIGSVPLVGSGPSASEGAPPILGTTDLPVQGAKGRVRGSDYSGAYNCDGAADNV
jgi:hypothetical protein